MKNTLMLLPLLLLSFHVKAQESRCSFSSMSQMSAMCVAEEIFKEESGNSTVDQRPLINTKVHPPCTAFEPCKVPVKTVSEDAEEFMQNFADSVLQNMVDSGKKDCDCLKDKHKYELGSDLESKKAQEKEKVNKIILEAYQRKFLNDFSLNMEEASFFITKAGDMFEDEEQAKDLQCNDTKRYDELIASACGAKNIKDEEFIRKRKAFFLKSNKDFEEALDLLSYDIQAIPFVDEIGGHSTYTRFEYDNGRIGLAHQSREAQIIDHVMNTILKNKDLKALFVKRRDEVSPIVAIMDIFEQHKNNTQLMGHFDHALIGDKKNLKQSFLFLMNTHPGFSNLMQDEFVFQNFEDHYKPNTSILKTLETNGKILDPVLSFRCNRIMQEFANAVCTPDDELIESMNDQDLELLIHAQSGNDDDQLHELLICENKKENNLPRFEKLANLYDNRLPAQKSDYLERILEKDLRKHKNMFTRTFLENQKNKEFRENMAKAAEAGAKIAKSVSAGGVVATKVYAKAAAEDKVFCLISF